MDADETPVADGQPGQREWPGWLAVSTTAVSDLLMLASLRFDLDRERQPAGVIEAVAWLLETGPGPATGRPEGPHSRDGALCELCAAECMVCEGTGQQPPPLRGVCADLGVRYLPPRVGDPAFGAGVYQTLRWTLGITGTPPLRLPLRQGDGRVMSEEAILAALTADGTDPERVRATAREMAEDSRRLAELVRLKNAARL